MTNILKGLSSVRPYNYYQVLQPIQSNHFQNHLLAFGARSISEKDYAKNCMETVKKTLQSNDYDFYFGGVNAASPLLELFKEVVSNASFMTADEMKSINKDFQEIFCVTIKNKLAIDAGKAFYLIPQLSEKEEKISSAQIWTEHFYLGLNSLCEFQGKYVLDEPLIKEFEKKTSEHLCDYAHYVIEQNFRAMLIRRNNDPVSFQRIIDKVAGKAPSTLSILEKEYADFAQMYANYTVPHFPSIDKNIYFLKQCIRLGFELEKTKIPIMESKHRFTETFKE